MAANMSRYTHAESTDFTFIGRAEGDTAHGMRERIEDCLVGLNLEPAEGWAYIPEGVVIEGDIATLLAEGVAKALRNVSLAEDHSTTLAHQIADVFTKLVPDFDRPAFITAATARTSS